MAENPPQHADPVRFPDQRSLTDQMVVLYSLAVEHGLYDACDWLSRTFFGTGLLGPSEGSKLVVPWQCPDGKGGTIAFKSEAQMKAWQAARNDGADDAR